MPIKFLYRHSRAAGIHSLSGVVIKLGPSFHEDDHFCKILDLSFYMIRSAKNKYIAIKISRPHNEYNLRSNEVLFLVFYLPQIPAIDKYD